MTATSVGFSSCTTPRGTRCACRRTIKMPSISEAARVSPALVCAALAALAKRSRSPKEKSASGLGSFPRRSWVASPPVKSFSQSWLHRRKRHDKNQPNGEDQPSSPIGHVITRSPCCRSRASRTTGRIKPRRPASLCRRVPQNSRRPNDAAGVMCLPEA